jgi:hypothetical protein
MVLSAYLYLDKKERDKAVESLQTWLAGQSNISDLDLLKLWKALFYCRCHFISILFYLMINACSLSIGILCIQDLEILRLDFPNFQVSFCFLPMGNPTGYFRIYIPMKY